MKNGDRPLNRILRRREVLVLLGAAGSVLLSDCAAGQSSASRLSEEAESGAASKTPSGTSSAEPVCVVRPEQTEGPYFVDEKLNRSDLRSDPSDGLITEGIPLQLTFQVSQMSNNGCQPLSGAIVDVWHCDALGVYSDVRDRSFNTVGKKFLRGYQVTNESGMAEFTTIYPGWYPGRAVHIHFKIRAGSEQNYEFTSQLYFDEAVTDRVHAQAPYASKGQRTLKNEGDGIFRQGGDELLLVLSETEAGYRGTFNIGLEMV